MVTVNDRDDDRGCWICGCPTDHVVTIPGIGPVHVPHSDAMDDGVTRYMVVDIMNASNLEWRAKHANA